MANKVNICGVMIDNLSMAEAIGRIESLIRDRQPAYVITTNTDHVVHLSKDKEFQEVYKRASLITCDGMPLVWASNFLGTPLKERVTGSDLFPKMCEVAARRGYKLFFLGGNPTDAEKAREMLMRQYPALKVVGVYCPPFDFEKKEYENRKIVDMIKKAEADILFVGLGAPKQEKWIYENYRKIQIPVSIGIGISFSLIAGTVKRAPKWMQRSGLEWLWRLMMEPKRLWKRYIVHDMKFFFLVFLQKLRSGNKK